MRDTASLFVDSRCVLGEGIVWWARHRALVWTDIESSRLWVHDAGGTRSWALPARLGSMAPCASGALLLGFEHGLVRAEIDLASAAAPRLDPLIDVEADLPSTAAPTARVISCSAR